jgi:hypothetical protein
MPRRTDPHFLLGMNAYGQTVIGVANTAQDAVTRGMGKGRDHQTHGHKTTSDSQLKGKEYA